MVGSLDTLSFYRRADSDETFVRHKGGPSKKDIMHSPRFVKTRHNMAEFGGRSTAATYIAKSLRHLDIVAKGTVSNKLKRPLTTIQHLDPVSGEGKRNIILSQHPGLLEGFSINKARTLESMASTPILSEVFPESATAEVIIPEFIPRTNLHLPERFPFYRFVFSFAIVPDFHYSERGYHPNISRLTYAAETHQSTEWVSTKSPFPGEKLSMVVQKPASDAPFVFVLGAAIQIGMPSEFGSIERVKNEGAGKILRVVPSGIEQAILYGSPTGKS